MNFYTQSIFGNKMIIHKLRTKKYTFCGILYIKKKLEIIASLKMKIINT